MDRFLATDASGYIKDRLTQAVINNDDGQYQRVMLERTRAKEIARLGHEVDTIRSELTDIKQLLIQIANGRQNG